MIDQAIADVLAKGGERITGINDTTRDRVLGIVRETVTAGMDNGDSLAVIGDSLEAALGDAATFGEYRSELIARTETMMAYNTAAISTYGQFGVQRVQAIDGDDDEVCAVRNGKDYSLEEAADIEDHPNGTLDWVPFFQPTPANPEPAAPVRPGLTPEQEREALIARTNAAAAQRQAAFEAKEAERVKQEAARVAARPVTAPTGPAGSPARIINTKGTAPVSDAFTSVFERQEASGLLRVDAGYRKVVDKMKDALSTIDKTFRDGNLPSLPGFGPVRGARATLQGQYTSIKGPNGTLIPRSLEFRSSAHIETVFHETAHFIDQQGIGFAGRYGSELGFAKARGELATEVGRIRADITMHRGLLQSFPNDASRLSQISEMERTLAGIEARGDVMEPVAKAIMDSDGFQALTRTLSSGKFDYFNVERALDVGTRKWVEYAIDPREVFARAMGQYLTKRHGQAAIRTLEKRIFVDSKMVTSAGRVQANTILKPLTDQWAWKDFEPIDKAITKMLRDVGWLIE